ncbi:enoyl-CoA hydratase/isomerase family protein [Sphingomonas immobilis]|uniref:Enoyl-CoA hydratase/isomerase family protein n=1 Tax=Sphingomonas immobilis TaxID=3063997 RepID=A0ABT8ZXM3_9SPHN|nr:enoyl-CoA hydratase/isomerase family protein [Sphingomonas sp. CA1-15]MDO7842320.1 enoyl-CoA hydratase/isomerase family protein [Sphingomonas sp. CA1-15]
MNDYEDITVGRAGPIGTLTLARPEKGNTLRPQTLAEICRGMDELIADAGVKAIVFAADGKHFCAGADFAFLDDLTQMPASDIKAQIYAHFQGAAKRIYTCPKPTVALVQGAAVTVGCELALACDFRIVAENAFFQESWIKLGIMPPLGGLFLLPRLIGLGRASQMVLLGQAVKAAEAERIGLAGEIVAADALAERGAAFAGELAAIAPLAYASVKEALHRGLETSMEAEWSANVLNQAILLGTEDFREGLAAVKAKRAPVFAGR